MTVLRIVANIVTPNVDELRAFYVELFDLDVMMDMGWIATLGSGKTATTQVSILSEGGSGAPAPVLSIEVDNVSETYDRACAMGRSIVYPLTDEPWGVRRFMLHDPAGTLINVLSHTG